MATQADKAGKTAQTGRSPINLIQSSPTHPTGKLDVKSIPMIHRMFCGTSFVQQASGVL